MSDPTAVLEQAVAALSGGHPDQAERLLLPLVAKEPSGFDALQLLGIARLQQGRAEDAVALLERALTADPRSVVALANLGAARHALGRFVEAVAAYDQALALGDDDFNTHFNRALSLGQLGRSEEALAAFGRALAIYPDDGEALHQRGLMLHGLGRIEAALADYERAWSIEPNNAEVLCNRGSLLHEMGQTERALASYDRALVARPGYPHALRNRAVVLMALNRPAEALAAVEKALAVEVDNAPAHATRGNALHAQNRNEEALAAFDRALAIDPGNAEALCNRGVVRRHLGRYEAALADFDRALTLRSRYADALNNRALALQDLGRVEEALAAYDHVRTEYPEFADARWNEGWCRLLNGDFASGWEGIEWRWRRPSFAARRRDFAQPLWLGKESIAGRTILLHAEQGVGDTLQFCRYAEMVAALGARVILEVHGPLTRLVAGLAGVSEVIARGDPLPPFDFHCPLMSLPLAFCTQLETIPRRIPYLSADGGLVQTWAHRLGKPAARSIGLVWSGNPLFPDNHKRSLSLDTLRPLLATGLPIVSLQKEADATERAILAEYPTVRAVGDELEDFADTAAAISSLDLIVSVDTSVAHLAGALGRPVSILLHSGADWRWLRERQDSPWYPTARLFRQATPGRWDDVVERLLDSLAAPGAGPAIAQG